MKKQRTKSSRITKDLENQLESCPLLNWMYSKGIPLTKQRYLDLAYPDRNLKLEPLQAEEIIELPEMFQER
jgi:hypothetical protein